MFDKEIQFRTALLAGAACAAFARGEGWPYGVVVGAGLGGCLLGLLVDLGIFRVKGLVRE